MNTISVMLAADAPNYGDQVRDIESIGVRHWAVQIVAARARTPSDYLGLLGGHYIKLMLNRAKRHTARLPNGAVVSYGLDWERRRHITTEPDYDEAVGVMCAAARAQGMIPRQMFGCPPCQYGSGALENTDRWREVVERGGFSSLGPSGYWWTWREGYRNLSGVVSWARDLGVGVNVYVSGERYDEDGYPSGYVTCEELEDQFLAYAAMGIHRWIIWADSNSPRAVTGVRRCWEVLRGLRTPELTEDRG